MTRLNLFASTDAQKNHHGAPTSKMTRNQATTTAGTMFRNRRALHNDENPTGFHDQQAMTNHGAHAMTNGLGNLLENALRLGRNLGAAMFNSVNALVNGTTLCPAPSAS